MTGKNKDSLLTNTLSVDFLTAFALAALAILGSHCDSNGTDTDPERELGCTNEPEPNTFIPLRVGNYWEYEFLDLDNVVEDSARWAIASKYPSDAENSKIFGLQWYTLNTTAPGAVLLFEEREDGFYHRGIIAPAGTLLVDVLRYPFPADIGEKGHEIVFEWDGAEFIVADSLDIELVDKNVWVETPTGTFNTHVYEWHEPPPPDVALGKDIFDFYSPGFGYIKREIRVARFGSLRGTWILRDFCVQKFLPVIQ